MPTLVINNETRITNVAGVSLKAIPVVNPRINVITVAGPKGDKGDAGASSTGTSGVSQSVLDATGALLNQIIAETGSILYNDLIGLSGMVTVNGVTQFQLNETGAKITALSGYSDDSFYLKSNPSGYITGFDSGNYATNIALELTGQQVWVAGQNNAINLSGKIENTGASVLAYSNSIAQSISGNLNASGRRAWDDATNLSGRLFATGALLADVSGGLEARISASTASNTSYANSIGENLSGNLALTGQKTWLFETVLSGNLITTGQNLLSAIASTGQNAVNYVDVKVAATGLANVNYTDARVAATGQQAWIASQNNALNLSGRLAATGSLLSAVQVTGSSLLQNANFTGVGGTLVIQSGSYVLISGASTPSTQNNSDGINLSGRLSATGTILVSNDINLSGAINASGRRAWNDAINLSGNLAATGALILGLSGSLVNDYLNTKISSPQSIESPVSFASETTHSGDIVTRNGAKSIYVYEDAIDNVDITGYLEIDGAFATYYYSSGDISINDFRGFDFRNLSAFLLNSEEGVTFDASKLKLSGDWWGDGIGIAPNSLVVNSGLWATGSLLYQLISSSTGGATNLSGYITTGQADLRYYSISNPNGYATSGNLQATGQNAVNYTDVRVAITGQQVWIASQNNAMNLSGNINSSGRRAWDDAVNLSGNLLLSGQKNWLFGTTLSGNLIASGQNVLTAIATTGQQAWIAGQNNALNLSGAVNVSGRSSWDNAINLSGNLSQTGNTLWQRDLSISGALALQIAANAAGVSTLNAASGALLIVGTGGVVSVSTIGQVIYVSGNNNDGLNLSGQLNSTGRRAWDDATNISGNLQSTGQKNWLFGVTNSGNLIATGQALLSTIASTGQNAVNYTDTRIAITGQANVNYTDARVAATGQAAWISANGVALGLSGNLTLTGQTAQNNALNLSGSINISGRAAWDNAINLSGRLTATGALLSAVQVTGSSIIQNVNLTGLGGTIILQSGGYVLISGAGGGSSTQNNGDGINLSGRLSATGAILVSNDLNISGTINASGRRAWDDAINLSGNLFSTGNLAILNANGVGTNLSGNLLLTGQKVWLFETTLSGNLITSGENLLSAIASTGQNAVNYTDVRVTATGLANVNYTDTRVAATGQAAWISANGAALGLSGNLTLTGQTAQNNALNLSGNLFSTGNLAILNANGIGINLSGRLVATGALLSALSVTGSAIMQTPNLSGIGTTLVIRSGNFVLISGAGAGAGGGEVNTASNLGIGVGVYNQKVLSDLQFNSILGGTGILANQSGQNIIINNPVKNSITMGMRESSIVSTGEKGRVIIGNNGFIVGWSLISKETTNLTLEVWKANKQNPVGGNNICPSLKPTLESMQYSGSANLTNWTTSVNDGDIMSLAVINNTASTEFTLRLDVVYL